MRTISPEKKYSPPKEVHLLEDEALQKTFKEAELFPKRDNETPPQCPPPHPHQLTLAERSPYLGAGCVNQLLWAIKAMALEDVERLRDILLIAIDPDTLAAASVPTELTKQTIPVVIQLRDAEVQLDLLPLEILRRLSDDTSVYDFARTDPVSIPKGTTTRVADLGTPQTIEPSGHAHRS